MSSTLQNVSTLAGFRSSIRKAFGHLSKHQPKGVRHISTSDGILQEAKNDFSKTIIIPQRIQRGPTDILKALATTVKKDYTAPHFKYHDDPFLIPTSNMHKRMFAMSQESGRKAAHWIRQEHSDLFQHKVADPPIQPYFPKAVYDDKSEVSEAVLQKVIEQQLVSDSLTIFGILEGKGIELSRSTKQSLLELVCYYNGQEALEEDWIEERWFWQGTKGREKKINTWRCEAAEKLFKNLDPADSASYSALICGRAQFGNMAGAYDLYLQASDAGLLLPVEVFNRLIVSAIVLKEGHELRWQFVEELLGTMKQQGVSPNLGTLNAILETISSMSVNKNSQKNALSVMAEFRSLGIEPSLGSYYFLLIIFCHDRSSTRSDILVEILNILEGKPLSLREPRDLMFFLEAMSVCRHHLTDLDVARRLDNLLHSHDNYNLIGNSFKESVYYRNFFGLACQLGTLQEFMELYDKLVPNVYVPEAGIMEEIIKTVELNEAWDLLPRLWSDMVIYDMSGREHLVCALLTALQRSTSQDSAVLQHHADTAFNVWERVETQMTRQKTGEVLSWTGQMLGDIVEVLLRADRYPQALLIMSALDKRQQEVLGVPAISSLSAFLDKSIEKNEIKNAIWCIQYCSDTGFEETVHFARRLNNAIVLSDSEKSQLVNIVGLEPLKKEAAVNM